MVNFERTKQRGNTEAVSPGTASPPTAKHGGPPNPFMSLDPGQWSAPIVASPTKTPEGDTYHTSVSLHSPENGKRLLA